jgi:hypothetical protein
MKASSKAENRELSLWYSNIKKGAIKLPRFQRNEAWDVSRIRSYLNTMIHNLPVGITLILKVGNEEVFESRYLETAIPNNQSEEVEEHLLDGQQRLTAFWRAINNNYSDVKFFVYFSEFNRRKPDYNKGDIKVIHQFRNRKTNGLLYPLWADSPEDTLHRGCIPLELFRPESIQTEISDWIETALSGQKPSSDEENYGVKLDAYYRFKENVSTKITELREVINHFNLPFLSLPSETSKDLALQVFINMNTNSKPLTTYDIIVAKVEEETGKSLHDLLNSLKHDYPRISNYGDLEKIILDTGALMQGKLPNNRGQEDMDRKLFVENWKLLSSNLNKMQTLLEEEGVFDRERLPTNAVLSVIASLYSDIPETGDKSGVAKSILKRYMWRAFFTERYSNSAASRALVDKTGIKNYLNGNVKDNGEQYALKDIPIFNDSEFPLVSEEQLMTIGWPKKVTIQGRGILALASKLGAYDFADDSKISPNHIKKREYHHIFPGSLVKLTDSDPNLALNCSLITWVTNRNIGNKSPMKYLKERYEMIDEEIVNRRLKSHLIPIEELSNGGYENLTTDQKSSKIASDYEGFLKARAKLVRQAIDTLSNGETLNLEKIYNEANLPERIDDKVQSIEIIEVKLRDIIYDRLLSKDEANFEIYIGEKSREYIDINISKRLKNFPGETLEQFSSARRKLDFLTLGQLKEIIIQKRAWDSFSEVFISKVNLQDRLDKLFVLRNQLAHNNVPNTTMLLDGEASIHWLNEILLD